MKILKQFLLYFHTIKKLKFRQVYYTVYYKFKKFIPKRIQLISGHDEFTIIPLNPFYTPFYRSVKLKSKNEFNILNIQHDFSSKINWNELKFGRLWNYHLQYAEFLLDENLSIPERIDVLEDLSSDILHQKLPLEPYPVSLRIVNTILFLTIHKYETPEIKTALKYQIEFLKNNLEFQIDGNHLLENLIALRIASLFVKDLDGLSKIKGLLKSSLQEQINTDGSHFERSTMYHCILLDRLLTLLGMMNPKEEDYNFLYELNERMVNFLFTITNKGRNYRILQDTTRASVDIMKHIFFNVSFLSIVPRTIGLEDSGYRILATDHFFAVFNLASAGPDFQPGHQHADLLGFEFDVRGIPVFVNPGISTYEKNERRELERSTMHHNTVCIDKMNQTQLWNGFRMARRSYCTIHEESSTSLSASVNFYHNKFHHQRTIRNDSNSLCITDTVTGKIVQSKVCSFFIDYSLNSQIFVLPDSKFQIGPVILEIKGSTHIEMEDYQHALDFNRLVVAKVIRIHFKDILSSMIYV